VIIDQLNHFLPFKFQAMKCPSNLLADHILFSTFHKSYANIHAIHFNKFKLNDLKQNKSNSYKYIYIRYRNYCVGLKHSTKLQFVNAQREQFVVPSQKQFHHLTFIFSKVHKCVEKDSYGMT